MLDLIEFHSIKGLLVTLQIHGLTELIRLDLLRSSHSLHKTLPLYIQSARRLPHCSLKPSMALPDNLSASKILDLRALQEIISVTLYENSKSAF